MKFFVYVLENKAGRWYIGQTNDLERRLLQHNDISRSSWAARRGPWKIVTVLEFSSRSVAIKIERQLKSLKRRDRILQYINNIAG
jgi:putative endonuclease